MTLWLSDPDVDLYHGDALSVLRELPSESVHAIVTSPPYFGLRDYGTGTWSGGDAECDHAGPPKASTKSGLKNDGRPADRVGQNDYERTATVPYRDVCGRCGATRIDAQIGLEPTPDSYASALVSVFREARRVLRSDGVCWLNLGDSFSSGNREGHGTRVGYKQATNTGTLGHDYRAPTPPGCKPKDLLGIPWLVAFALRADGWYLRSDVIWAKPNPMPESVTDRPTKSHEYVFLLTKSAKYAYDADAIREEPTWADPTNGTKKGASRTRNVGGRTDGYTRISEGGGVGVPENGRNARSVWSISTEPTPFAHFATMPTELVARCIKAGCPADGVVLDMFAGSGTSALVARRLGRKSIGIELNEEYLRIAAKRLEQLSLLADA